jgi:hypothetical protein
MSANLISRLHNILPAHSRQLTDDLKIDRYTIPKGVLFKTLTSLRKIADF